MPGFDHDPLADVDAIRQLLDGYKTGYPFLKEALQNAQDAGATRVWFQWHQGLGSQAEHPLLKGPALIIVNDGPFDEESQRGIRLIGLSNRAADVERIGRFGLGIKSLFHVCEGFFYMESKFNDSLRGFLTPWHASEKAATRYHQEWWSVGENDWRQMADEVAQALPVTFDHWFAIWIPLRTSPRLDEIETIRADCPGTSFDRCDLSIIRAFEASSPSLADSMIFLDRLNSVDFHDGQTSRLRLRNERGHGEGDNLIGATKVWVECFKVPHHPGVQEIQDSAHWPKVSDRRTGGQASDKASWEGGVAVSLSPVGASPPALRVFWSVFLPVGSMPAAEVSMRRWTANLNIFLHGYFFPNRDRTLVFGAEDGFTQAGDGSEDALKQEWNRRLATSPDGVLPSLIPTLENFFHAEGVSDALIEEIVRGLSSTPFFTTYMRAVCQGFSYARCLTGQGWSWQRMEAGTDVLSVPCFEFSIETLERILLDAVDRAKLDRVIIIQEQALLGPKDMNVDWDSTDLSCFCESLRSASLKKTEEARDFVRSLLAYFQAVTAACPESWQDLPLYPVESIRGEQKIVSTRQILQWHQQTSVFRLDGTDWPQPLRRSCPGIKIWFIRGVSPPGFTPLFLDSCAAGKLVLSQNTLGGLSERRVLLQRLLSSMNDHQVKQAVRYLMHGSFECRSATESLYFCGSEQVTDRWGSVMLVIFRQLGQPWRALHADLSEYITPDQASTIGVATAGASTFRDLCRGLDLDLSLLPLESYHDFLMQHLVEGTHFDPQADNKLLRKLKIHEYGRGQFTVLDDHSWLEPEAGLIPPEHLAALWSELRLQACIVRRADNPHVVLRQQEVFGRRILDSNGIISLCCAQPNPHRFGPLIVFCLGRGNPNTDARDSLQKAAWLPVTGSESAKIEQLLWLENAEDELDVLLRNSETTGFVITRSMINLVLDSRENKGAWNTLSSQLIPKGDDALALLGLAFETSATCHLGIPLRSIEDLANWLRATETIEQDFSRARRLIQKLWPDDNLPDTESARAFALKVASTFARSWRGHDAPGYDNALEALRQRHEQAEARLRSVIGDVFCGYLKQAFVAGNWERYRQQMDFLLLNQRGDWKSVRDLVRPCEGLDLAYLLDAAQASVLGLYATRPDEPDQPGEMDATESAQEAADLLRAYGESLPKLHRRCWGAFVSLLGDDQPILDLAEELTGDASGFRNGLIADGDARDKLSNLHFRCTLLDGTSIEMHALNGDLINVPVSSMEGSFLVPDKHGSLVAWEICDSLHIHRIRLLSPDRFQSLNSGELLERLKLSIQQLLNVALRAIPSDLETFFNQILDLQEQSLGVAQQTILIGAEMHLQQLAWRKLGYSRLEHAFKLLGEAKNLEALARQQDNARYAGADEPRRNHQEASQRREEGLAVLESLLRDDQNLHSALSNAMRRKIGESGYIADSIPFELFQNADDAVGELKSGGKIPEVFVAEFGAESVRFAHWGRVINSVSGAGESWMAQDLVKMILLNGSDKSDEGTSRQVTGKFGLGFKSVYLICDQPRVISGSLEFEVRGATYPARLPLSQASTLRNWLTSQMPAQNSGTAFELRILTADQAWRERFETLAPYLPLFAKHLKEIRINGPSPSVYRWSAAERVETGACVIELGGGIETGSLLKISSSSGELSWLFSWADGEFQKLADPLPCLWITVPTRTRGMGIVLNGPFEPDPGRAGLGTGAEAARNNASLFTDAAVLLANGLKALKQGVGEAEFQMVGNGAERFWQSAWDLFSTLPGADRASPAAHDEVIRCVWQKDRLGGYSNLVANHRVIPNGLPGAFAGLTSTGLISYRTTGFLEHTDGRSFLNDLGAWQEWSSLCPDKALEPARIATSQVVSAIQRHLGEGSVRADDISLRFILDRLLGDGLVTEKMAALLGAYLSEQTFLRGHGYQWLFEEEQETHEYLESLLFLSADGEWVKSRELLSGGQSDYEPVRAGFAPAARLLAEEYVNRQAQNFFRLCRGDMQVTAEEMADWIRLSLNQEDGARVAASLKFLASGDDLTSSCAGHLSLTERSELLNHAEFPQLEPDDQNRIKQTFNIADAQKAKLFGLEMTWNPRVDETEPITEPLIDLEDLINEWDGHEQEAIQRFTLSGHLRPLVFPDVMGDDNLRGRLLETESIKGRESWYRLLCLGCALSLPLGRTPYDRIMRFWEQRLGDDFWLATIPESLEGATSPRFEQRLDKFFEDIIHRTFRDENASGEEADFWRRVFYDFRKMHFFVFGESNLPALILQIASSDGVGGGQLVQFLRSGHVPPSLQTPGHERWAGVVGQSMSAPLLFVMRELRRLRILPEGFDSACYYMNSPARRVASRLGWIEPSQQGRASFADLLELSETVCHAVQEQAPELAPHFDLPLQWFAHQNL